jgi:rhodanese-related sulfurtransferase
MTHSTRFQALCVKAVAQVEEVSVEQVTAIVEQGGVLIDVREDHEWQQGYLLNAAHMGRGILERDIEKAHPDVTSTLVLYCGGGYRSALAAVSLQTMGYTNVKSLQGGYKAWVAAGFDINHETT